MKPSRFLSEGIVAVLALQLLGLLLYANTLGNPPVWDDHDAVFNESFLMDCQNLGKVLDPGSLYRVLPVRNSARPAWLASVLADSCLYAGKTAGYRVTNFFWHAWGAACLLALMWLLTRDRLAALFGALLFLVHPLHTEAVNLIAFRSDLLSLAWMALSLVLYLESRGRKPGLRLALLACSLLSYGLAMLSKEMAVTLPLLLLAADALFPGPRPARRPWAVYAGYFLLLFLYLAFRLPRSGYVMEGHQDVFSDLRESRPGLVDLYAKPPPEGRTAGGKMETPPWSQEYYRSPKVRLLTASRIAGESLRRLVWPHPLQADYAPMPAQSWLDGKVWAAWLAWLLVLAGAWTLRKRQPAVSFGLLWIPATLLPVSGLVALKNLQADRYLYTPSAGFCLAAAGLLAGLIKSRRPNAARPAAVFCPLLVALLAGMTFARNRDYRDEIQFYRATLAVDGNIPRARFGLAQAYANADRPREAEAEFRAGLELWPGAVGGRLKYAQFLESRGRPAEAALQFRRAQEGSRP